MDEINISTYLFGSFWQSYFDHDMLLITCSC